jgi:hypothetical protein
MTASDFGRDDLRLFRESFGDLLSAEFCSYLSQMDEVHQPLSLLDLSRQCFRQQVRRTRKNILHVLKTLNLPYRLFGHLLVSDTGVVDVSVGHSTDQEIESLYSELYCKST